MFSPGSSRYSAILRDEAGNVRRTGDDEFNNSEIMKTNCEVRVTCQ